MSSDGRSSPSSYVSRISGSISTAPDTSAKLSRRFSRIFLSLLPSVLNGLALFVSLIYPNVTLLTYHLQALEFSLKHQRYSQVPHLSAVQGIFEQRTEPYMQYGEGVAQNMT